MVEHVVAQVSGSCHVVEDLREVGHVVVDRGNRFGRVHPVVIIPALAESAHLFILLVVLKILI